MIVIVIIIEAIFGTPHCTQDTSSVSNLFCSCTPMTVYNVGCNCFAAMLGTLLFSKTV